MKFYYKDKNSGRQNSTIALKEYDKFDSYVDIVNRELDVINTIIDECLPMLPV